MTMSRTKRRSKTPARRKKILEGHDHICGYCHEKIAEDEEYEIDHATPLAMGGADDDGPNSYPIHKECHRTKTFGRTRDQKRYSDISNIAKTKRIRKNRLCRKNTKRGFRKGNLVKKLDGSVERRGPDTGKMR